MGEHWFPFWQESELPRYDTKWDSKNDKDERTHNHFIHCIFEDLRRDKRKPQLLPSHSCTAKTPRNPNSSLQRVKCALQKHTNIVPESQEEEIILKDKFQHSQPQI
jgi:hypothetical protein